MPIEYQALVFMTFFFAIAWVPVSIGKKQSFGVDWIFSNREKPNKELAPWADRCERAHNNLKDNFPAFAAAIILLGILGKFDEFTMYAALTFVVMRVIHYASYGAGVFYPRTIAYFTGLFANFYLLIKVLI